ncbi:hypothetical protein HKX48_007472 [Thoreauomyces humboldtii]|nr:hypothetical protein HKX48_007472 [Thoreauomyces humboldtii]
MSDLVGTTLPGTTLRISDVINSGSFATVYHAVDLRTDESFAVKALEKTGLTKVQTDNLWHEVAIMRRLMSEGVPNVVRLENVIENEDWLFMVLERCGTDLYDAITQELLPRHTLLPIFHTLCVTMCRLHSMSIYHRDLKPENIFLTTGSRRVRVGDFGLSTTVSTSDDMGCGSTRYMAPECLPKCSRPYDCGKADAWSLGIILVNLVSGKNPWYEADLSDPLYATYLEGQSVLRETFGFSEEFEDVLKSILDPNPATRCSVADVWPKVKAVRRFFDSPETPAQAIPSKVVNVVVTRSHPSNQPSSDLFTASPPRYSKFSMHDSGFESQECDDMFAIDLLTIAG